MTVSVILLCGGTGTRMRKAIPKQFLEVHQKMIAHYSFELFEEMEEVSEIIVVADPLYRHHFSSVSKRVAFALPGKRRQDSVFNGLQAVDENAAYICVHDSARPLIDAALVRRVLEAAVEHGAATAGMPVKFTVKEHDGNGVVKSTPDRSKYWEIQTPQVIRADLLRKGFDYVNAHHLEVTDDVSVVEHLKHPVKLVEGSYNNLKITTVEDLLLAEHFLKRPSEL
jgi:2-C-methyl-D-erythritol 4-phosphate cytidylyltransferase